ncbi:glucose-6-phosphate dehydrogenase [uncultured Buchnera sp.]|jgi:glucose-6-phosphate 1-dehydrogenase|uniref:glucose-6-phosphate dehydrogenase n=1 Tax=uncultured Buchnera sp. TaxID=574037 RepID=UPI0025D70F21|nr:glucose-6-phosphate dehydrogenase [uncultured Buchnera sp.]
MITETNQACDLVIFGTKGDLARRKLLPALYKLEKSQKIHPDTRIIGAGRADWNTEDYIKVVKKAIKNFLNEKVDQNIWKKLSARLNFFNIDVFKDLYFLELKKILNAKKNIFIYYCAVPPNTFNAIFKGLGKVNLNSLPSRIIIEKPLGVSLETSKKINKQISKYFLESQIFRIDHYLGKESILNLLALRFSNSFFFHSWNNKIIDHIQITVSEEVGIENRWNYFDQMGQTRDMVQNHLLQILTIVSMDQPKNITPEDIRQEKLKILRSLKKIDLNEINVKTARGQYTSGIINGKTVPAYTEENGANKDSKTETFISIRVDIDNDRWFGVPFYLRTGKRLASKYSEIVIVFKKMSKNLFQKFNENLSPNKLIIRLEPNEGIKIEFLNKVPGLNKEYELKSDKMECKYPNNTKNFVDAYERLLFESMRGIQSLFVCRDEVEEAWKWIDPIINAWKKTTTSTVQLYKSGTWGPKNSDSLIMRDGRFWETFN